MRTVSTVLPPHVAYELWADTYPAEAHNPLMAAEEAIVTRILTHLSAKRALDLGTGSGRYLPVLAARAGSVVGLDLSMAMLMRAPRGRSIRGDARCLPFRRGTFDLVNASLMVGDVSDLGGWAAETARVMTSGGHLVYSDFHPSWLDNGWERTFRTADGVLHAVEYTPHTIDAHLAALSHAGLRVLAIREPRAAIPSSSRTRRFGGLGRRPAPVLAIFHAVKTAGPEHGAPR